MKRIPEFLYHYTSPQRAMWIKEDGFIDLTSSNWKYSPVTMHQVELEPRTDAEGNVIQRFTYKDKYSDIHKVVWLTANERARAEATGLSEEKTLVRLTIPTKGKESKFLPWSEFCRKYHADPQAVRSLKEANGGDWKNWYVCEMPIPWDDVSEFAFK